MATGFIGLGNLGTAIARRLIEQGEQLVVFNRTRAKAEKLGVPVASSPAELATRADAIFLNLFDSQAVNDVLTGRDGLLSGDCAGKLVIDTTTNHFESVGRFHELLKSAGGLYLEAPVAGSVVPALQGSLTVLVSGEQPAHDRALPYLNKIGKHIFYIAQIGLATKMKLVNNLALGSFMAAIAEAVMLGQRAGIPRETVLDILAVGGGNSAVLNAKRQRLLDDDYTAHFSSSAIYKDLHYVQDLARSLNRPVFTAGVVKELYGLVAGRGEAEKDFSVIFSVLDQL